MYINNKTITLSSNYNLKHHQYVCVRHLSIYLGRVQKTKWKFLMAFAIMRECNPDHLWGYQHHCLAPFFKGPKIWSRNFGEGEAWEVLVTGDGEDQDQRLVQLRFLNEESWSWSALIWESVRWFLGLGLLAFAQRFFLISSFLQRQLQKIVFIVIKQNQPLCKKLALLKTEGAKKGKSR